MLSYKNFARKFLYDNCLTTLFFVFDLVYAEFEFQISASTSDSALDSTSDSTLDFVVDDFGHHARTINKINTAICSIIFGC